MLNKYSKIRLILSLLLIIPCGSIAVGAYQTPDYFTIDLLPVSLFSVGSIMFVFNKLWADIISFFAFILFVINGVMLFVSDLKYCRVGTEPTCPYYYLDPNKLDSALAVLFLTLIFMILSYLLVEFFKKSKRVYK